jgi:leucyl-tRNA synthetase
MSRVHYKGYKGITLLARDLRKNQTPAEKILWEMLRKKQVIGYKFLRQHPIFYHLDGNWVDFYIADFYCSELKLIIELDGPIHDNNKEYDFERDSKLMNKGIQIVRIKNEELKDIDLTMSKINSGIKRLILQ